MKRYTTTIGFCAASCVAVAAFRSALGDEVTNNAVTAHKRLKALHTAVSIYTNDSEEQLDDPIHLMGSVDLTPQDFWHPGDNDPTPTSLDNSIPNAPNSTQISFIFQTGYIGELPADTPLIWDANPLNNAGRFVSYVTADGGIETIPPVELPYPTNVNVAQQHLARIMRALWWYAHEHSDVLPNSLLDVYDTSHTSSPRTFWNPGDLDPLPTDITNTAPDAINSANISFEFPAAGMSVDQLTFETVILRDNSPANNRGLGVNVVIRGPSLFNPHIRFIPSGLIGDTNGDDQIDLADWARLQQCYTSWSEFVDDDSCRLLDFNFNGRIESLDQAEFLSVLAGPTLP
jgi:hypothetical protein